MSGWLGRMGRDSLSCAGSRCDRALLAAVTAVSLGLCVKDHIVICQGAPGKLGVSLTHTAVLLPRNVFLRKRF